MSIIWHYLDKRSAAINALKDYNSMKYIIDHTDEEICLIYSRVSAVSSSSISVTQKGTIDPHSNENRVVAAIDEIDVLKERYRQAVEYMDWFKPAWLALSEDERYVLSTFYWNYDERKTDAVYEICERFNIERSSAYNKKNRAVQHLALLLFGK